MDNPITRAEHDEFARRMEDEHSRQNHRINDLEKSIKEIGRLTSSVSSLAKSVLASSNVWRTLSQRLPLGFRVPGVPPL